MHKKIRKGEGFLPFPFLDPLNNKKNSKLTFIVVIIVTAIILTNFNQSIRLELYDKDNWALRITDGYYLDTKISINDIKKNIKVCIIDSGFNCNKSNLSLKKVNNIEAGVSVGHGTLIANIIGSKKDSKEDYFGLIPGIDIYIYDIKQNELNTSNLAKAIIEVVDKGINIINISLSTTKDDKELFNSVKYALDKGVTIVCSSGNTGNEQSLYPASYNLKGLISVGAIDRNMNVLPITTFNNGVDVFAPGENICNNMANGTSLAAPIVTSLVILMKAKYPNLNPQEIEIIIKENANNYNVEWKWVNKNIKVISFKKTLEYNDITGGIR